MVTGPGRPPTVGGVRQELRGLRHVAAADRGLVAVPMLAPHLRFAPLPDDAVLLASDETAVVLTGPCFEDLLPLLDGSRTRQAIVAELQDRHSPVEVQTALVRLASDGFVVSAEFDLPPEVAAFWSALGASPRFARERLAATRVKVCGDEGIGGDAAGVLLARLAGLGAWTENATLTGCAGPLARNREGRQENRAGGKVPREDGMGRNTEPATALGALETAPADDRDTPALQGPAAPDSSLRVVVTADYLSERHAAILAGRDAATAWVLVQPTGGRALFGPVFRPDGPCWRCLAWRLSATRPVESALRSQGATSPGALTASAAAASPLTATVCGLAAMEIARWIVFRGEAPIHERLMSFDAAASGVGRHHVPQRPQCPDCGPRGDEAASSAPPRLASCPTALRNSGGTRSVRPEETLRRFRHLVDPLTGVVTALERVGDPDDSWCLVYRAQFASALPLSNVQQVRQAPKGGGTAGKGSTPGQAEASALCEAIERYSGILQGGETVRRGRLADFADGDAIHPNDIDLWSAAQFEAAAASANGDRRLPPPFDASQPLDWTPVWSFTADAWRHVPTRQLYFSPPASGVNQFRANSNGCASGNTLEEAILQGFFELVERDAFACWWYNRIVMPSVDLSSFGSPWLGEASARYERLGRELWLLDLTHDLGIPVFVAVSRRAAGDEEGILQGAGCHLDPLVAAMRAVSEMNQMLLAWPDGSPVGNDALCRKSSNPRRGVMHRWLREAKIADRPHLAPDPTVPPQPAPARDAPDTGDLRDDVELCRKIVEDASMEFLVLDQTRPDLGLPVARVLVPGLRHFWPRFAPGRLYDVPVAMGWRDEPLTEADLDPHGPPF